MVLQFFLGFLASFVAATPPGLLNLTSLKISLEKGKEKSYSFAFGVSIIIFIQTYFSLIFTNYIHNTSNIETSLQFIGFILFSLLSFYFFYKGIKEKKVLGAALDVLEFEKKSFEKLLETSMSNDDFSFLITLL